MLNKTMPAAKKGEVDVMLSILSKSPPCPGKREPLFFNPTFLLKTLIVRSPTIDNTVIAKQNGIKINTKILYTMDYRLTDEDKERIKLLNEVFKNKFKNFSLEQLIRLQELLEKKDYSNQKKAEKSKKKLLSQINVEIYKRDDAAIWK